MMSCLIQAAVLAVVAANAQSSFDKKLSADERILHALNRLTFGPRPADVELVRRIGLEKWIGMQLHPDSIAQTPMLEARLKPLETLWGDTPTILKDYPATTFPLPRPLMPTEILPPDPFHLLMSVPTDDRRAVPRALH